MCEADRIDIIEHLKHYNRRLAARYCLCKAYEHLFMLSKSNRNTVNYKKELNSAKWYYDFVRNGLISDISDRKSIKLYCDIKKELSNYHLE